MTTRKTLAALLDIFPPSRDDRYHDEAGGGGGDDDIDDHRCLGCPFSHPPCFTEPPRAP